MAHKREVKNYLDLESNLILLTIKKAIHKASHPITTTLIINQNISNLSLNVLMDILLKYPKLRNTDSKIIISSVVWKKNLENGILKNPKEICPGTERGGVILMRNNAQKKRFFICIWIYWNTDLFSNFCILFATRILICAFRLRDFLSILCPFSFISRKSLAPNFLANLPTQYRITSPIKSPKIENRYTMPKEKNHWAAIKAQIKLTAGPSANINANIIKYLYLTNNTMIHSIQGR